MIADSFCHELEDGGNRCFGGNRCSSRRQATGRCLVLFNTLCSRTHLNIARLLRSEIKLYRTVLGLWFAQKERFFLNDL